jgi:signal recognition particle GTPase
VAWGKHREVLPITTWEGKRQEVAVAQDFTLADYRRQLGRNLHMDMEEVVALMKTIPALAPDPSEQDLALAIDRLRQRRAALTEEERHALDRLPRMFTAMRDEELFRLQLIRASVQGRQIIDAMTDEERSNPALIDGSRRSRIATSAGTDPEEVETFLAQFHHVRAVVREVAGWSLWQRLKMGFRGLRDLGTFKALNGMLIVILVVAFVFILVAKLGWVW